MSQSIRTVILSVLAVGLMVLDYHQYALTTPIRITLAQLTAPIHYLAHAPTQLYVWAKAGISSHQQLVQNNARLQAQLLVLNARLQKMSALQSENNQLRAILNATQHIAARMMVTQLIALDSDLNQHIIVIDRGHKDGAYIGQPILDSSGVMGQIIQVNTNTSRALLTDRRSAIPVQDARNGVHALAKGVGMPDKLILANVAETADIKRGDIFVSSGLGQRYPMGYPVAVVARVIHSPHAPYVHITMRPLALVSRSRQLVLIWPEVKG